MATLIKTRILHTTMQHTHATNTLEINLDALTHNYRVLQSRLKRGTRCSAVVKANAYGLGVAEVSQALHSAGCDEFFVATLEEGLELRKTLQNAMIYVLYGITAGQEILFLAAQLAPVLNDPNQIALWQTFARTQEKALTAILHVDTGMGRLGLDAGSFPELWQKTNACQGLDLRYIMSHLACANEAEHFLNRRQLRQMQEIQRHAPNIPLSFANSSGIFLGEDYHMHMVRPGSALYGVNPLEGQENPMRQIVTAKATILQVRHLSRTETVGYGATYEAQAGTKIAVLGMGYADGYFRSLSNKGSCYIAGCVVPVIGRVSMDLITLDVSRVPEKAIYPGAEVELIGEHITVDDVARQAGTIGYEVLTDLGRRYRRVYR